MGTVWGGAATLIDGQPVRLVDAGSKQSQGFAVQIDVVAPLSDDGATVDVWSGASQALTRRTYLCRTGRIIIPVAGQTVYVDASRIAPGSAGQVTVTAMLGESPSAQSPFGAQSAIGQLVVIPPAVATAIPAAAGSSRLFFNDSAGAVALRVGGLTLAIMAAGDTFATTYCGPAIATAAAGANLNVITLQA